MNSKLLKILFVLGIVTLSACSSADDDNSQPMTNGDSNQQDAPERTSIPDEAFEASLIDLNFDDELDGSVLTSSLLNLTSLVLNDQGISSLVGIEDMPNLENLWANNNLLTSLNVSQNSKLKFIFVDNNEIDLISTSSLPDLEKLSAINNALTAVDVTNNLNLQILTVAGNTINNLDVSSNSQLNVLSVIDNPLDCIKVSSAQLGNIPEGWEIDPEDSYSLSCN